MSDTDAQLSELIARAKRGDELACEAIYRRFAGQTYRLAYGVLLNKQDAEEVVQDSFAYAFRRLDAYDPAKSAFRTWLYTITMSRCRNKRRRKLLPTVALSDIAEWLPGGGPSPERTVEQAGTRRTVLQALEKLSPKLREAIVLRYFDGLTYREIAEVLGCAQKTAESRVRLGHQALYRLLAHMPEGLFTYD
jgi:RNA polymerase sigma-70 factor (ECF subfamily)